MAIDVGLITFAATLGVFTFFSPCAIALLPSYIAYFAGTEDPGQGRTAGASLLAGFRFGGAAAVGMLAVFAVGGSIIFLLRTRWPVLSGQGLLEGFTVIGTLTGVLLVALGALLIADRAPAFTVPVSAPQQRTLPNMAAFGAVYAVASMGCTLPLFFGLLGAVLTQPLGGSLVVLGAFATGMAGLMLGVSVATALAEGWVRTRIGQILPWIKLASGVLLVLGGLYIVEFYQDLVPWP